MQEYSSLLSLVGQALQAGQGGGDGYEFGHGPGGTQQHCPNARVVYDLFHVIAKFERKVIDRVRVDQSNRLKQGQADPPNRQAQSLVATNDHRASRPPV